MFHNCFGVNVQHDTFEEKGTQEDQQSSVWNSWWKGKNNALSPAASSEIKSTSASIGGSLTHPDHHHRRRKKRKQVLLEIVGAVGLGHVNDDAVDSYCVVRVDGNVCGSNSFEEKEEKVKNDIEVHRTKTVVNDTRPIWTLKTKSLCLLELEPAQGITVQLCCSTHSGRRKNNKWSKTADVVGQVRLRYSKLIGGTGDRHEFSIPVRDGVNKSNDDGNDDDNHSPDDCSKSSQCRIITLALRFRPATRDDCIFLKEDSGRPRNLLKASSLLSKSNTTDVGNDVAAHMSQHVTPDNCYCDFNRSIYIKRKKVVQVPNSSTDSDTTDADATTGNPSSKEEQKMACRVWPFPDPDRPEETSFLTKEQIHQEAKKPSTRWVGAGFGGVGTVHLEILGCDNLPNMDTEYVTGKTDAFCACVLEGKFVRTSIIKDSLNPRWMPWSYRAFMFHTIHPSSILMLGVFDYDALPYEAHNPIGRVVIHLDEFDSDTVYTLTYPLYDGDTQEEDHRGTITIRLRINRNVAEANNAKLHAKLPRFIVNTETETAWKSLRYVTRGSVDMTEVTIKSVKLYFSELIDYWKKYCYLLDVGAGVLLWRGATTVHFFGRDLLIWFPMHSVALFLASVISLEYPEFLPSIFLYGIAYCLLCVNYHASSHPLPWKRVRCYGSTPFKTSSGIHIQPGVGAKEADTLQLLDMYKSARVTGFLYESLMIMLKVYRIYSKNTPVDISTVPRNSGSLFSKLYVNYLSYAHLFVRLQCRLIRVLRNFVNWKVRSTHTFTTNCLMVATLWCFFPFKHWAYWMIRIATWTCFGPWMKLVDILWIRKYYRTKEELLADGVPETIEEMQEEIANRPNIFLPILETRWVESMIHSGRIVTEDNVKLKDIREKRYGKWSERIPSNDTSRFPSVPFDTSFAQPYYCNENDTEGTSSSFLSSSSSSSLSIVDESGEEDGIDDKYVDIPTKAKHWSYFPGQKLTGHMIPEPSLPQSSIGASIAFPIDVEDDDVSYSDYD